MSVRVSFSPLDAAMNSLHWSAFAPATAKTQRLDQEIAVVKVRRIYLAYTETPRQNFLLPRTSVVENFSFMEPL